jgi:hypothetical protein
VKLGARAAAGCAHVRTGVTALVTFSRKEFDRADAATPPTQVSPLDA